MSFRERQSRDREISFPHRGLTRAHSRKQGKDYLARRALHEHLGHLDVGRDYNGW